jgi:L-alanine-DL-glutamate epimerase-like enolase superfamily enzyme
MSPLRIEWASVSIPFRQAFAHASATRRRAQNVIVRIKDAEGRIGFGEGCPRDYVTGETVQTAVAALGRWRDALEKLRDVRDLRDWLEGARDEATLAPSAACAAELALLDLFARRAETSVEGLLGLRALDRDLPVTAVYGSGPAPVFLLQTLRFRAAGMNEAKLKLTGDPGRDARRARRLARFGPVRADANNLWPDARTAVRGLAAVRDHIWAVEEPVGAGDLGGLADVAVETGLAVILDESFSGPADLTALPSGPRYLVNMRLSRLGGLLRTLDVAAAARARGVGLILGAHVGETGLLARAGLAAAGAAGLDLAGYEGAYGTWLLARDAVTPTVTFGRDGRLSPGRDWRPDEVGWGLEWAEPTTWTAL